MLDIFNIPSQQDYYKIYYASDTNTWQTWTKPRNCKFIWMMCIGAGNGGYGMTTSAVSEIAGGGSGAVTRALFPANVLPDILYVQPGSGGAGGLSGGNNGGIGGRSYVSIVPNTTAINVVCISGTVPAAYSNAEGGATTTVAGLLSLGQFVTVAGTGGSTGGDVSVLAVTGLTTQGGSNSAGGAGRSLNVPANLSFALRSSIGGTTGGGNGAFGTWSWKPMFGVGGAGGGGNASGVGGKGGDGAYGCGGGSGGYGTTSGGNGGRGGDGLVIIATF